MELVSEHGAVRTYRSSEDEWVEVRATVRGQSSVTGESSYAIPAVRDRIAEMTRAQLLAWFADEGEVFDRLGETTTTWTRVLNYQYVWDEENDTCVLDEDGEPVIATDQHGHPITYFTWRCLVEQVYWPAPPSDGT